MPEQTGLAVIEMLVGAVGAAVTVIDVVTPPVFPEQGEDCVLLTQYVVFAVGETVMEEPVPEIVFDPTEEPVPH